MLHHAVITALSKTNQAIKDSCKRYCSYGNNNLMALVDGPLHPLRNQCACNVKFLYTPLRPGCSIELLVPINYWKCDLELQIEVLKDL